MNALRWNEPEKLNALEIEFADGCEHLAPPLIVFSSLQTTLLALRFAPAASTVLAIGQETNGVGSMLRFVWFQVVERLHDLVDGQNLYSQVQYLIQLLGKRLSAPRKKSPTPSPSEAFVLVAACSGEG